MKIFKTITSVTANTIFLHHSKSGGLQNTTFHVFSEEFIAGMDW